MTVQLHKAARQESSYDNIPSCSWPNHSSDVVKWSSRGSRIPSLINQSLGCMLTKQLQSRTAQKP